MAIIKLIQQHDRPNATLFARELEVTRRTIMRDLDFLRDRMHVPIEYDATRKGYYFSEPVEGTPLLDLRESDLLWLFVGQHLLEHAGDGGIADQVRQSFQRVSRLFGGRVSVRWDQYAARLTSKAAGLGKTGLRTFEAVSAALVRRVEIRFDYLKAGAKKRERRQVQPRHCAFVNGQWYLFAHDPSRSSIRAFVLSRMSSVTVTDQGFTGDDGDDIPALLEAGFGAKWSHGPAARVRIRVSPAIAHLIREREWHPSQTIRERRDRSLILEMQVNTFRELTSWICSWGPDMKVLEPINLRERVAQTLKAAAAVYENQSSQMNKVRN